MLFSDVNAKSTQIVINKVIPKNWCHHLKLSVNIYIIHIYIISKPSSFTTEVIKKGWFEWFYQRSRCKQVHPLVFTYESKHVAQMVGQHWWSETFYRRRKYYQVLNWNCDLSWWFDIALIYNWLNATIRMINRSLLLLYFFI